MKRHRLSTTPTREALAKLAIGDIVHLDGVIYTAREGVYKRALEEGHALPVDLPAVSAARPPRGSTRTARSRWAR